MKDRPRILLVDDDPGSRKTLQDILEYSGFACIAFGQGQDALAWAAGNEADAALVDLQLGDISGLDVARRLREHLPDIECLLVTGHASQTSAIAAVNAGVYAYIQKPYDIPQLLLTLHRAIERRAATRALRESQQRYQTLAELSPVGIFRASPDGKIVYVNQRWCEIAGISRADALGDGWLAAIHPQDRQQFLTSWQNALQTGQPFMAEYRLLHPDGSLRWVIGQAAPETSIAGELAGYVGAVTDITERKQAAEELQATQNRLRAVVEQVPLVVYTEGLDKAHATLFISPQVEALCGYTAAEWMSDPDLWKRVIHPDDQPYVLAEDERTNANGQPYRVEYRLITRSGEIRWIQDEAVLIRDENGQPLYWQGFMLDITPRKHAEAQMRLQSAALEASANAIVITDRRAVIQWANSAFTALTGYSLEEAVGKNPRDLVKSGMQGPAFYRALWDTILSGKVWHGTLVNRRKDGSLYDEEMTITPLPGADENPEYFIAIKQDITERKRQEAALRASERSYAALLETSPAGIFRTDAAGLTTYVSPRWCEIAGLDAQSALGNGWLQAVHPDDQPSLLAGWQQAAGASHASTAEYRFLRPDGSVRWVRGQATPETDAQGRIIGYVGAILDITEAKQAEEALRASETRYRGLFEDSPISLWEEDFSEVKERLDALRRQGVQDLRAYCETHPDFVRQCAQLVRIRDVNRATLRLFGAATKEALLQSLAAIFRDESYQAFQEELICIANGDTSFGWEGVNYTLDGRRLEVSLEWTVVPGHEDDLQRVIISMVDVTERQRAEAELRRRADEMAALYETARALAAQHDLLPLLHAITEHACALLHAPSGGVYLYDSQRGELELTVVIGTPLPAGTRLKVGQGMAGRVAQSCQALIVEDYQSWEGRAPQYDGIPFRAVIQAPMLYNQNLIGVLSVEEIGDSERKFTQQDIDLLMLFANQAALAVGKARLYEETRQRMNELETLYEASQTLNRLSTPRQIGEKLLEIMGQRLAWHHVTIRLRRGESHELELVAFGQADTEPGEEEQTARYFAELISSMDQGLSGLAARRGETIIADDVHAFPEYLEAHPAICSGLYVPLKMEGRVIGVVSVESEQPAAFSPNDARLLETLAAQAAVAFENARLYQDTLRASQRREVLYRLGQEISQRISAPEAVYEAVYQAARQLMCADNFTIVIHDEAAGEFVGEYLIDEGQRCPPVRASIQQGISGHVIRTRAPLSIGDALSDSNAPTPVHYGSDRPSRAYLAVPLLVGERVIGAMSVQSYQPHAYTPEDQTLLEMLAAYAAPAIENARLLQAERQHAENLKAINAMGRALAETFDTSAIYEQVRQSIFALLPDISGVMINRFDHEKQLITPAYCYTDDAVQDVSALPPIPLAPPGEGTQSRAIHSRQPLVIHHFQEQLKKARIHVTVGQEGPPRRSSMYVPMLTQGKVVGLIVVQSPREGRFSDADVELVNLIANTAAVALENARLFDETRRRVEQMAVVNAMGRALAETLDMPTIFLTAYRHVRQLLDCPNFAISLFDARKQELRLAYLISDGEEMDAATVPPLAFDLLQASSGRAKALATARVEIVNDLAQASRQAKAAIIGSERVPDSAIYTPMVVKGEVLGLLELQSYRPQAYSLADSELLSMLANQVGLTIYNARLFAEVRRHDAQMATVNEIGKVLAETLDLEQIYHHLVGSIYALVPDICGVLICRYDAQAQLITPVCGHCDDHFIPVEALPLLPADSGLASQVIHTRQPQILPELTEQAFPGGMPIGDSQKGAVQSALYAPMMARGELVGVLQVYSHIPDRFTSADADLLALLANTAAASMENSRLLLAVQQELAERKRAEETLAWQLKELLAVNRVSTALRSARNLNEMLPILLDETLSAVGAESGVIWLYNPASGLLEEAVSKGWFTQLRDLKIRPGEGISGQVFASGELYVSPAVDSDPQTLSMARPAIPAGWGGACVPIRTAQEIVGVLFVSVQSPRQLSQADLDILTTLSEIAGNAIHRTRLFERTERQVQRLSALHAIDTAISASMDLHLTLNILLDQLIAQLRVDAAAIWLIQPDTLHFTYFVGRGFRGRGVASSRLHMGEDPPGQAALERRLISVPDIQTAKLLHPERLRGEEFVSMYAAPLVAKGQVKGVLEIFTRTPSNPDDEWLDFLDTLAGQAAIAIDSGLLFSELQAANVKLSLAYDATIEGWSRAMDLRDKETEGHSQRVTELTLEIARQMGIAETELVHIRRGALLHDLGKLGIPDQILFKSDKLSDEEWEIMRKHPAYAYEMLLPIEYLHPALDIPYCHHEKWDGTGYPRGLKGEEIPLAARIFAVADVWDALTSDRPYRQAWSAEDALAYIQSQAGQHFDPRVVEVFVRWMKAQLEA